MAKDAKGHGSEARSGHEHAIAVDTVKNPLKGLFLGGPNAAQAESNLRGKFGYNDAEIGKLKGGKFDETYGLKGGTPMGSPARPGATFGGQPVASNAHAAATLASGPKSVPVDTHPAMAVPKMRGSIVQDIRHQNGLDGEPLIPRNNFKRHGF
jgi:hypothetical protein